MIRYLLQLYKKLSVYRSHLVALETRIVHIRYFYTMKAFAVILAFGFAWQVTNAYRTPDLQTCLIENGFTDGTSDMLRVESIGYSEDTDILKDVSNDKMASVFACLYQKQYGNRNLKDDLKSLVERDDKVTKEDKIEMLEKLNTCNTNAAGDNAKLLSCLKIIFPPFDHVIGVIRDIPASVETCYFKCGITIGEMYRMDQDKCQLKRLLKIMNDQKIGCFSACKIDEENTKKPGSINLLKELTKLINKSEKHDENQKKELLKTLNTCNEQVAAVEDKTYELIKCINLYKPPFLDLY